MLLKNRQVNLIEDIRRQRLQILINEYGSIAALAQKLDRQPAQVSQWKNASTDPKTGKPRHMKSDTARRIESCTGKPDGWMDQPVNESCLSARQSVAISKTQESDGLTDDEKLLILWFRQKSSDEKKHFLSILGLTIQSDFAKSA